MLGEDPSVDKARQRAMQARVSMIGQQEAQERRSKAQQKENARIRKRARQQEQREVWVQVEEDPRQWASATTRPSNSKKQVNQNNRQRSDKSYADAVRTQSIPSWLQHSANRTYSHNNAPMGNEFAAARAKEKHGKGKFIYDKIPAQATRKTLCDEFESWLDKQDFSQAFLDEEQQKLKRIESEFESFLINGLTAVNHILKSVDHKYSLYLYLYLYHYHRGGGPQGKG